LVIFFINSGFLSGGIGHVSIVTIGILISPQNTLF
jgi:hypothetical protein